MLYYWGSFQKFIKNLSYLCFYRIIHLWIGMWGITLSSKILKIFNCEPNQMTINTFIACTNLSIILYHNIGNHFDCLVFENFFIAHELLKLQHFFTNYLELRLTHIFRMSIQQLRWSKYINKINLFKLRHNIFVTTLYFFIDSLVSIVMI